MKIGSASESDIEGWVDAKGKLQSPPKIKIVGLQDTKNVEGTGNLIVLNSIIPVQLLIFENHRFTQKGSQKHLSLFCPLCVL